MQKTVQVVIEISQETYDEVKKKHTNEHITEELWQGLYHGTVLPKHGRLIDADALESDCYGEWNGLYVTEDTYKQSTIDNAPTILEA